MRVSHVFSPSPAWICPALFRGEGSKTRPLTDVIERLAKGEFDMVAVGRALLQDPFWAQKVREGRFDELGDYDAVALKTLY